MPVTYLRMFFNLDEASGDKARAVGTSPCLVTASSEMISADTRPPSTDMACCLTLLNSAGVCEWHPVVLTQSTIALPWNTR